MARASAARLRIPPDRSGGSLSSSPDKWTISNASATRAIVHKPGCVLFDEPHTGLDPINADAIDHLIKDLQRNQGVTNIVITHELRSVFRIADRIVFLEKGRIHWTGTPAELQATHDPILRAFIDGDSGEGWGEPISSGLGGGAPREAD